MRWKAEVHVWPHAGEKVAAGDPVQFIEFDADRITDAVMVATMPIGLSPTASTYRGEP